MIPPLKTSKDVDIFQLAKLLADAGWPDAATDLDRVLNFVRGATRIVWAAEGDRLVGFASSLSDGAAFCFVTHLVVRPDRQKQGIGRAMLARLLEGEPPAVRFAMNAAPEAAKVCERLGFSPTGRALYQAKAGAIPSAIDKA